MTTTPLHQIGASIRDLLVLVPLPMVRVIFLALLAAVLLWVLSLPRSETTGPTSEGRSGANLKVGASIALGMQLVIYLLL
ncbi:MAG: hypothetical protein KDA93_11280 [Planctomycetaceae bacterium]|nr:hypothetical protein [Planctomycetaceae bacterium]